ncbi:MAG: imidazole glycerol phosphate synthase subunit HisH, partial [Clostridia bacterium]|nr:imidazole glycerol phosphate synthase subunit HisH [Clostridia bacterium]
MIAIVDYGVGNLFSLISSFNKIGADIVVTADPQVISDADGIILPGVGAFEDAARKLRDSGLDKVIVEQAQKGKKLMGICLGMQMLFQQSYEYGCHEGLGLLKGNIVPMKDSIPADLKI